MHDVTRESVAAVTDHFADAFVRTRMYDNDVRMCDPYSGLQISNVVMSFITLRKMRF